MTAIVVSAVIRTRYYRLSRNEFTVRKPVATAAVKQLLVLCATHDKPVSCCTQQRHKATLRQQKTSGQKT